MPFFGSGGSNSRGDESSPIASSSPASRAPPMQSAPVQIQEGSESSTDEGEKQGGRKLWREEENLRLVSAWLKNSNDPIDGNGKPRDRFWKEIAAEYNKNAPKQQRRTAMQCKEHWHKNMPLINKFNGVYNDVKNRNARGQSDDQLMEEVRAKWKGLMKKKRPFPLEHWWAALKDQPKWARAYPAHELQKRIKLNSSGAYSSSSAQDTDGASVESRRPQGRDAAKSEKKKGKQKCSEGSLFTEESMQKFNELQLRKSMAAEKMAEAALAQAAVDDKNAENNKERNKLDKLTAYIQLFNKDTSGYDEDTLGRHKQVLDLLAKELFP